MATTTGGATTWTIYKPHARRAASSAAHNTAAGAARDPSTAAMIGSDVAISLS
ncbi:hypothetical protein [Nonomuraea sp. B5E05]|uniref:hypothetical protein n=1 Tax=Nonomuraea sp. B5E05 TaxID=3153569 RepID=UPI00326013DF